MKNVVLTMLLWGLTTTLATASSSFTLHEQGWHWYQRLQKPREESQPVAKIKNDRSPQQELQMLQDRVEAVRAKAVLYPTRENVAEYIFLQNKIAENADVFSRMWQTVLWQYPFLNYQLQSPVNQASQTRERERKEKAQDRLLHDAGKTMGLVFFLSDTCPYCREFAPTVKAVGDHYHLPIVAVSVTGKGLPTFPNPLTDSGQAKALHVTHLPALFVVSPKDNQLSLVTLGLLSETALVERLASVIKTSMQPTRHEKKRGEIENETV